VNNVWYQQKPPMFHAWCFLESMEHLALVVAWVIFLMLGQLSISHTSKISLVWLFACIVDGVIVNIMNFSEQS